MNILLVEDDDDIRALLKNTLRERGHQVADYSDGENGWQAYQSQDFPMILLDWLLPGMSGLELCKKIRSTDAGGDRLILMITVRDEVRDLEKALSAGVDDYLTKPFSLEMLNIRLTIAEKRIHREALRKREFIARQHAETALNNSRSMLQLVIDSIPNHVFWKNKNSRFLGCNSLFAKHAGFNDPKTLIGKSDIDMPWSKQAAAYIAEDQEVIRSNQPLLDIERSHIDKHGKQHWLTISKVPLTDASGNTIGILGTYQDNTEKKLARGKTKVAQQQAEQAQQDLSIVVSQLEATLNASADGLLVVSQKGEITRYNQRFLELWHIPDNLIDEKDNNKLIEFALKQLKEPEAFIEDINALHASKDACSHDTLEFKDGRIYERHSQPQWSDNNIIGRVWSFHDITESEHDKQKQLIAKEHAINANRMKSDFISKMSHELRTPLNAILGFSKLFEYDTSLTKHQKSNANEIYQAGEHLLSLIDDVLDLTKIEGGYIELSIEPVSLSNLAAECQTLIEPLATYHAIQLDIEIAQYENIFISADYTRLKQVLLNLLSNAVKYNRKNGAVSMKISNTNTKTIRIDVTDTGPGIPEKYMADLFQPFNRLGAERSNVEGTGIGLVITQQLVELMHGNMGVDSSPGSGSTFWVELKTCDRLPAHDEDLQQVEKTRLNTKDAITPYMAKILIAEDNKTNQEVLAQQLNILGYKADFADNGEQALSLWQKNKYHLLLSDINMPKMDGYELVRNIRQQEKNKNEHIPIIAITANAMRGESQHCKEAGMDAYVSKPISLDDIKQALETWLPEQFSKIAEAAPPANSSNDDRYSNNTPRKTSPIDINAVAQLVGSDPASQYRVLKSFNEGSPKIISALNISVGNQDADGIAKNAHKLKSSAKAVGAFALSETCETLEAAGINTEWDMINKLHPELILQFDTISAYINKRYQMH